MSDGKYVYSQIKEKLVGGKIIEPLIDADPDDQDFPGFLVRNGNQTFAVWVTRDSEGNGPGWLDVGNVTEELEKAGG